MSEGSGWALDPWEQYVAPVYTPPAYTPPAYAMPTGMQTYADYRDAQNAYASTQMNADPQWQNYINSMWSGGGGMDAADASSQYNGSLPTPATDYYGQWYNMLSPQQQAEFDRLKQEDIAGRWQTKVGNVMQYIPAAVATLGTLGASGALSGTALGELAGFPAAGNAFTGAAGATAGAYTNPAYVSIPGVEGGAALEAAGAAGAAGSAYTNPAFTAIPSSGVPGAAEAAAAIAAAGGSTTPAGAALLEQFVKAGALPAGTQLPGSGSAASVPGSTASVPGTGSSIPGVPTGMLDSFSGLLKDYGGLVAGLGGLVTSMQKPDYPPPPDYAALAEQQARLNQEAADKALIANRPNMTNAAGDQLTWTRDPVTGQWTQTQKFGDSNQALFDSTQGIKQGLLGDIGARGDYNFQGTPLMDPVGNSSDIQQAWMNLLTPYRDREKAAMIQRLKSQGLTEDSPAFQTAMRTQMEADTDAQNKALVYGTQEYGNQFARALQSRGQQFGEYDTTYNSPTKQYQAMSGMPVYSPGYGSYSTTSGAPGANVYGAGQDQYTANLGNTNANLAYQNNISQGLFGLANNWNKYTGGWGG